MFNKTANFVKRFLVFREEGQPLPRERPSLRDANPTAGPSMNPPREVRSVESSVVEERNIPNIPVESVGPRTFSEDWAPIVEYGPKSHPLASPPLEASTRTIALSEGWGPSAGKGPRSFPFVEPPSLENMADSYNMAEYWSPTSPGDGGGSGGAPPPLSGGGDDEGPIGPHFETLGWGLALLGFGLLSKYAMTKFASSLKNSLGRLEAEESLVKAGPSKGTLRAYKIYGSKAALLAFAALIGGEPLNLAIQQILIPEVRRIGGALPNAVQAIVPPEVRGVLAGVAGRLYAWPVRRFVRVIRPVFFKTFSLAFGLIRRPLGFVGSLIRPFFGVGFLCMLCPWFLSLYESLATTTEPYLAALATASETSYTQFSFVKGLFQATFGTIFLGHGFSVSVKILNDPKVGDLVLMVFQFGTFMLVFFRFDVFSPFLATAVKETVFQPLLSCQLGRLSLLLSSTLLLRFSRVPGGEIIFVLFLYYYQLYKLVFVLSPNLFPIKGLK